MHGSQSAVASRAPVRGVFLARIGDANGVQIVDTCVTQAIGASIGHHVINIFLGAANVH